MSDLIIFSCTIFLGFSIGLMAGDYSSKRESLRIECEQNLPRNEKCVMAYIVEPPKELTNEN